jgi:mono/diheme cytochrome c family protein
MPHFSKEELSDVQLDAILEYLKVLHQNHPSRAAGTRTNHAGGG